MQIDHNARAPTPRWVKLFGLVALGLVLLVAGVIVTGVGGPHGPGRHISSDLDSATAPAEQPR